MKPGLTLAAIYRAAAARLRSEGWFQGAFAVTEDGREVDWSDPDVRAHCALGALYVEGAPATTHEQREVAQPLLSALVRAGVVKVYDEAEDERRPFGPGDDLEACLAELDPEDRIGLWNDDDKRTAADVTGWLERVADELEPPALPTHEAPP